jgi:predicted nucleic acid-binding protein
MGAASFIDTNVLVYWLSADANKADIAETILLVEHPALSVQVLNEAALVLRRRHHMEWSSLLDFLAHARSSASAVVPLTTALHERGLPLAQRYRLGIYDSMIVAAALLAGCETLYSEDMQDGLLVEQRLRIINPFREA